MSDRAWKAAERRHAADVGVRRIPVTGVDRHGADFVAGPVAYQIKHRRALPSWLFRWLAGITSTAARTGQIGALVLSRPGQPRAKSLVIVSWQDWLRVRPDATEVPE